jgi:hypothetical protein
VPIAYHYRYWLKEYALPALIEHSSTTLPTPLPLDRSTATGPTIQDRQKAQHSIFASIAQANLRMVLLQAQDLRHRSWLSPSGTLVSDVEPTQWKDLQNFAVITEHQQARRATELGLGKAPSPPYRTLVHTAVASFSEQHVSIMRQIATCRQETAEITPEMHPR